MNSLTGSRQKQLKRILKPKLYLTLHPNPEFTTELGTPASRIKTEGSRLQPQRSPQDHARPRFLYNTGRFDTPEEFGSPAGIPYLAETRIRLEPNQKSSTDI